MLYNYLIIALRNMQRNKLHTGINIFGLSIGIAAAILILLWVHDETTYDQFIPKADRLNQLRVVASYDNKIHNWQSVPLPTYEALKTSHSSIIETVVTDWGGLRLITNGDIRYKKRSYWVSEEFLSMFEFEMVAGNRETALSEPNAVVLTTSMAKLLFGEEDPMGKSVRVLDESTLQVTGIVKDLPKNSTFQFDYLLPWKLREQTNPWVVDNKTNWGNYSFQVFVELNDPMMQTDAIAAIKNLLVEKGETEFPVELTLYNMLRWRLYSNFENGKETGGRADYVQLFTAIAFFILLIACINFMNLATARSEKRIREVGIRKSMGSTRRQLITQFIGESFLISLIAFILALVLASIALPFYNQLVQKSLTIPYQSLEIWLYSFAFILFIGLISGSYPAFYFSSFNPAHTLKGTINIGKQAGTPRKVLVTLQFCFTILMIISTIVIYKQIELARNRALGYNQANLITVDFTEEVRKNFKNIKTALLQSGSVASVTRSNSTITEINSNNFLEWPGKPADHRVIFTTIVADYDYTQTMGIKMLQGRDFDESFSTDTAAIVVNQAALDIMNLEDPLSTNLKLWGRDLKLIGVMDNVLMGSPYEPFNPLFVILEDWGGSVTIRLKTDKGLNQSLEDVKAVFEKFDPAYPFEYQFVDEEFNKKFVTINLTHRLASIFAILTLIITGLGLFGLASYSAEQKTKEIGVRKVLGASVTSIVLLMSKETTKLVVIAFILSAPLSGYLLSGYLKRYTLSITIEWWMYGLAGFFALLFSLTIVAQQANRAARLNPSNALKSE